MVHCSFGGDGDPEVSCRHGTCAKKSSFYKKEKRKKKKKKKKKKKGICEDEEYEYRCRAPSTYPSRNGLERLSAPTELSRMGIVSAGRGPSLIERYAPSMR